MGTGQCKDSVNEFSLCHVAKCYKKFKIYSSKLINTWYCYLHSWSTIHKQTVVKWYCVMNASKLYMVLLLHSLSTIHKQTVAKWYCVVNASKLYMVLLSTQLIHHS